LAYVCLFSAKNWNKKISCKCTFNAVEDITVSPSAYPLLGLPWKPIEPRSSFVASYQLTQCSTSQVP
jgi:hypothetical protein